MKKHPIAKSDMKNKIQNGPFISGAEFNTKVANIASQTTDLERMEDRMLVVRSCLIACRDGHGSRKAAVTALSELKLLYCLALKGVKV